MRIGMILSSPLPPREGIGFYAWNLARYLVQNGNQVHLITRGGLKLARPEVMDGITIWKPPFLPIYPLHVYFHNLFITDLLHRLEKDLDLLHLHTPLVILPKTNLPVLVTVHTPLKADLRSVKAKNLFGLLIKLQTPVSLMIEANLYNRADRFVAVANSVANELDEYGINFNNISVVGNGVDTNLFRPRQSESENNQLYFLTVARLAPRKGLEDLIEAARIVTRQYPQIKFVIVGSGPLYSDLRKLVKKYLLQAKVIFTGQITDRALLIQYYQRAFVYVHPAHYEGLPTVLLEAMACGKAVISTAVSGALDVVINEVNGLLIEPRQPNFLAQAMVRVVEDPDIAERLGTTARKTICDRYSWELVGDRYIKEYHALLEGHRQ